MAFTGGYSDKLVEPGVWKVDGASNGAAERGLGRAIAGYHAAEVVGAAGFKFMQIIDQKGSVRTITINGTGGGPAGESMTLWVRGADNPSPPTDCRATTPDGCYTINVTELMAKLRPQIPLPVGAGQ